MTLWTIEHLSVGKHLTLEDWNRPSQPTSGPKIPSQWSRTRLGRLTSISFTARRLWAFELGNKHLLASTEQGNFRSVFLEMAEPATMISAGPDRPFLHLLVTWTATARLIDP
jgi:hypothetical protein